MRFTLGVFTLDKLSVISSMERAASVILLSQGKVRSAWIIPVRTCRQKSLQTTRDYIADGALCAFKPHRWWTRSFAATSWQNLSKTCKISQRAVLSGNDACKRKEGERWIGWQRGKLGDGWISREDLGITLKGNGERDQKVRIIEELPLPFNLDDHSIINSFLFVDWLT